MTHKDKGFIIKAMIHFHHVFMTYQNEFKALRDVNLEIARGEFVMITGPSGAGKSTLVNLLVPGAYAQTGEISQALNSGKHTTTTTTLYWIDKERTTALIDSPGFQEFGLRHIGPMDLARCMPDIAAHAGDCKFYNCTHLHEPGCGVIASVLDVEDDPMKAGADAISANRYRIYGDLFEELSAPEKY